MKYIGRIFQQMKTALQDLYIPVPFRLIAVCAGLCFSGMEAFSQSLPDEQMHIEKALERIRREAPDTAQARQQAAQFLERFESFRNMVRSQMEKTTLSGTNAARSAAPVSYNWYVSVTGSDNNNGTSPSTPLRTIGKAIEKASQEHVIKIDPGIYQECLYIEGKYITLVGNPGDPSTVVINAQQNGTAIHVKSAVNIYGLTITEGYNLSNLGGAIYLDSGYALLYESVITGNFGQSVISSASTSSSSSTISMQNCLIHSNNLSGFVLDLYRCSANLSNTTIADNQTWASAMLNEECNLYLTNCILNNPAVPFQELVFHPYTINYLYYNNIRNFSNLQFHGGIQYSNNIDMDPGFVSRSNKMYQLAENSPCIDMGDPHPLLSDLNRPPARGESRNDMGAYGGKISSQPYQVAPPGGNEPDPDPEPVPDPVIAFNVDNSVIPKHKNWMYSVYPQTATTIISDIRGEEYKQEINYSDGFGRALQSISIASSPGRKDIVNRFEYDQLGRESVKYLPYESSTGTGSMKSNNEIISWYRTAHTGIPADNRPYSKTRFEPSPMNRVVEEYGPGEYWYNAGKKTVNNYRTNTAGEVLRWTVSGSQVSASGNYTAGTLYVTETTDEDMRMITEYTDLQGRVIRRQQRVNDSINAITDYVFDELGRLRYVLPPAVSKIIYHTIPVTTAVSENSSSEFAKFVYAYVYDARGRVIEKHIPGAGWTYIIYDRLDQPVLTQDVIQQEKGEWAFTKYDAIGRVVMSGVVQDDRARSECRAVIDAQTGPLWESPISGGMYGYTNRSLPVITEEQVNTVNYYDRYDFTDEDYPAKCDSVQGLPTGGRVRILDTNDWLTTTLFYDNKGRMVHSIAGQPKIDNSEVKDKLTHTYDFTGKVLSTVREHLKGGTAAFVLTEINRYDHAGRLLEVKQHITGNDTVVVAANTYNELGELIRTDLHNGALESTTYNYNIRGWLKEIAGSHFSQKLHYHESVNGLASTPQWGGNISAMEWQTPSMNGYWHAYGFGYDPLSRLTGGNYSRSTGEGNTVYGSESGHFNEDYSYDIMGNITGLNRYHGGEQIDSLTLSYNGNQLGQASDAITPEEGNSGSTGTEITRVITLNSPAAAGIQEACEGFVLQPGFQFAATSGNDLTLRINEQLCTSEPSTPGFSGNGTYGYDAAGRMTTDSNKGITIAYNHLNLPTLITKDQETLEYTYDATGRRIRKKFGSKERHYIDGVEYEGSELKFISTQYGRIRKTTSGWVYDYFLKDHLGNVRVVLTSDPDNVQRYMATMEESKSGEEGLYFDNLESTRSDRPYNYPDKNPSNAKLAKVAGKSQGPKITLKVMAGDTIEISAQAFYNIDKSLPGSGLDIAPVAASAIAALSGNVAAPLGEFSTLATDLGAAASTSAVLASLPAGNDDEDSPQPESGLNFVLYNREFEVVEAHTGILPVDDRINKIQQLSGDKMVLSESGYMEIYVNNEAQTPVYFDNLSVTRSSGNAVEVNAYYPYGMIVPLLSDHEIEGFNAYKYNAKELQEEMELNWLDYGARMLGTEIPVWFVPDPLAEKYYGISPYVYVRNNPILRIDPNGLTDFTFNKKTGEVKQIGDKNDDLDRILKTNRKGEIKYKKDGEAKVAISGIEQGILKDGQDFNNKDQVISVGGEGQPSVEGVKSFTLQLSEYVGKEIKGFSYSSNTSGDVTDMVLGKFKNNTLTKSYGSLTSLIKKYGNNFSFDNVLEQFHTHPNGKLGSTQSAPELSQDVKNLQSDKPQIPNANFIILYRIPGLIKPAEYDYTRNYRPKKR